MVGGIIVAGAIAVRENNDLRPAKSPDEITVALGVQLLPKTGGFEHRGAHAPSSAAGPLPGGILARFRLRQFRRPFAGLADPRPHPIVNFVFVPRDCSRTELDTLRESAGPLFTPNGRVAVWDAAQDLGLPD